MGRNLNIGSRGPRLSTEERFWKKAVRLGSDRCWPWDGAHTRNGYANFWDGTYTETGRPHMVEAHRWAFSHFVSSPGDLDVLHTCDVRDCTNFERHLYSGTHAQNMRDRDGRGRGVVPSRKGQGTKLTMDLALEIRLRSTGARGEQRRMALEYGVCHQLISDVLANKLWVP